MFMMGDDMGGQTGPLVGLEMWRRYFRDGFRTYCDIAHKYGLKVMYHTCGDVYKLIPDFIENGLDCIQALQPQATNMDIKRLKQEFGKDLSFQGGMDIQQVLRLGSPEDVRKMVKYSMDHAKQGGGYIICTAHSIQVDPPHMEAIFPLAKQYQCKVIALTSSKEGGIPPTSEGRVKLAETIAIEAQKHGVPLEDIYFDPMVLPLSTDSNNVVLFLET